MNTKQKAKQLRIAADIIEQGLEWQWRYDENNEWREPKGRNASTVVDCGYKIRLKPWTLPRHLPGFRPLEPGEQWHRDDWTKDMLPEGWRPLLLGEVEQPNEDCFLYAGQWQKYPMRGARGAVSSDYHCRARRQLPAIVTTVPWDCPEDVPGPVCWIRLKTFGIPSMIVSVEPNGLVFIVSTLVDAVGWKALDEYEHSTDRKTWLPCTKEVSK